jgi:hypothetical protein
MKYLLRKCEMFAKANEENFISHRQLVDISRWYIISRFEKAFHLPQFTQKDVFLFWLI